MCWSASASLALGTATAGMAGYAHTEGESTYFTLPLFYFSLMEFLQFFSYFSINQCALESNTALTFLSYVHIAFQPLFINMFLMATSPRGVEKISRQTKRIIFSLTLVIALLLLTKLVPFFPASICAPGQTLCSTLNMCTMSGSWHLAWYVPQYNLPLPGDGFLYYGFGIFFLPLFYGAWVGILVLLFTGPLIAYALAGGNPNEWPAIWCLYSVLIMLTLMTRESRRLVKIATERFTSVDTGIEGSPR